MLIFPAIDIIDGKPVRLFKGDFSTAHQVAGDAVETAFGFLKAGCKWVHMVDLDGAKDATLANADLIIDVAKQSGLKVEVGGGIRDTAAIERYLNNGIDKVILGSAAVKNPDFVIEAVKAFGDKIVVGIDAKNGMVCAEGWIDESEINYIELAKRMENIGVGQIVFTDIDQDGTLAGPNLKQLDDLVHEVNCRVVASGGVSVLKDIINLAELDVYGAICGKAIYTGNLDLKQAIEITSKI